MNLECLLQLSALTVDFGAPAAQTALLALPSLEQTVVDVPHELVQLGMRRVHDVHSGLAQDPPSDPPLRGQGHHQEDRRAEAQCRGRGERHPFPQGRHRSRAHRAPRKVTRRRGSELGSAPAVTISLSYCLIDGRKPNQNQNQNRTK